MRTRFNGRSSRFAVAGLLMGGSLLAGCGYSARPLGKDLIITDAPRRVLSQAVRGVHEQLGNPVKNADGSESDASFKQSGQVWRSGSDKEGASVVAARGRTEFKDAAGRVIGIEYISHPEDTTLVFVSHVEDDPVKVLNALLKSLRKLGVKTAM